MHVIENPEEASIILTSRPSALGTQALRSAIRNGSFVAVDKFITSGGTSGCATCYRQASATKRHVWLSDAICAKQPAFTDLFRRLAAGAGSKVRILDSFDAFRALVAADLARPKRQQRNLEAIAVVTDVEKRTKLQDFACAFTVDELLTFLPRIDKSKSIMGLCGF